MLAMLPFFILSLNIEHTSSILIAEEREPPNIADTNSIADTGQEKVNLVSPFPPSLVLFIVIRINV